MALVNEVVSGASGLLVSYPDVFGRLLGVSFPDEVTDDRDKAFRLVMEVLMDLGSDRIEYVDPGHLIQSVIRDANEAGRSFTPDEQEVLAGKALACQGFLSRFFAGKGDNLSVNRAERLRNLLLLAGEDDLVRCREFFRELDCITTWAHS